MVLAFIANEDHIPDAAHPFCHVGIAGQELLLAPGPDLDVNQRVSYEATAGPIVGAWGHEVEQPKLAFDVEAAQECGLRDGPVVDVCISRTDCEILGTTPEVVQSVALS